MASTKIKGITVEIGGDTTKLGKALSDSEKKSRDLQKELKDVEKALKFNPDNVELLTQKQKLLTEQVQATADKLKTLEDAQEQVSAQFARGEIGEEQYRAFQREIVETTSKLDTYKKKLESMDKSSSALENLTDTIQEQETAVDKLKNEYKDAVIQYGKNSDEAKKLGKQLTDLSSELRDNKNKMAEADRSADELDESLDKLETGAKNAGEGFTVLKGAVANLVADLARAGIRQLTELAKSTVDVGKGFQKSMSEVQAISGATGDELKLLSDTAKEFGASTQFSASQSADALKYMALAGWDAETSTSALGGVLDLAAASGMDLARASDMVTDYMSAFGLEAKESAKFADTLAYAQANANTTVDGLGEAFRNCAANMNAAGQDVETTTSLLSMLANQGLKGSEAGTALTAVMRDMTKKMKDGAIQVGKTSVKVQDANGNYRDMTDILKDVEKATQGMGDAEKASALQATFTADSIKGLNLILNAGVDEAASFEEELRNASGTASDMAKVMNDNLAGDLTALGSQFEGLQIQMYQKFEPALRKGVAVIKDLLKAFEKNLPKMGKAVDNLMTKIQKAVEFVVKHKKTIITTISAIAGAFAAAAITQKVQGIITAFNAWKKATEGATLAQKALNSTLLANPYAWVAAALGALVAGTIALVKIQDKQIEKTYGLNDAEKELIDRINEETEAYKESTKARDEANKSIDTEFYQNKKLWGELQNIVDENGKIKKGYEDRANVITGLLADSLGVEIKIVDGQIQKYDELKKSIEEVISTKRAEALLDANKEGYTQAIQDSTDAYNTYTEAVKEASETAEELRKAEQRVLSIRAEMSNGIPKTAADMEMLNNQYLDAQIAVDELSQKYDEQSKAVEDAESKYLGYANTIENYEGLMAAVASGDADELSEAMNRLSNSFVTADNATEEMLSNQLANFKKQYENMKAAVAAGMPGVTQEQVEKMGELVDAAQTELDKLTPKAGESGKKAANEYAEGLGSESDKAEQMGAKNADAANKGLDSYKPKETGKKKGAEYAAGIKDKAAEAETAGKTNAKAADKGLASSDTKTTGKKKGGEFASGLRELSTEATNAGKKVANSGKSGAGSVDYTKTGESAGGQYDKGLDSKKEATKTIGKAVANSGKTGAGSVSLNQVGRDFISGFKNGMSAMGREMRNMATSLARGALSAMKVALGIKSPSKETAKIGKYFDEGFINAIAEGTGEAVTVAENLAEDAADALAKINSTDFNPVTGESVDFANRSQLVAAEAYTGSSVSFTEILDKLDAVINAVAVNSDKNIVLDTGVLVGQTISKIDDGLANRYTMKARGSV